MSGPDLKRIEFSHNPGKPTVRPWIAKAHAKLKSRLPFAFRPALVTEDLTDSRGRPRDVFAHFGIDPRFLRMILPNYFGFLYTLYGGAPTPEIIVEPPAWKDFETVWIPVQNGVELCGRLSLARDGDGRVRNTTCVVVLPGFYGDNNVIRSKELSEALVQSGLHAVSLEMRGHGQVELRYPDRGYTFGVIESGDLLLVDEWLRRIPGVDRTGMIGFCWSANTVMLAAWLDGRTDDEPDIGPTIRHVMPPRSTERHFEAGVLAFSPVLHFEQTNEQCDTWMNPWFDPCIYAIQETIRWRIMYKGWGRPHYSLRRLIDREFANSELGISQSIMRDALRFLRFMPHRSHAVTNKMERARVPLLMVHGANDPFIPAQLIADFTSQIRNPNVAAIILPDGGHIGFAPYARSYYYSLVWNFFDPRTGPAAAPAGALARVEER